MTTPGALELSRSVKPRPATSGNLHQLVIARPDQAVFQRYVFTRLFLPAFDFDRIFGDGIAKWGDRSGGGRLDAGQGLHPLGDLGEILIVAFVHGAFARFVIGRRIRRARQFERHHQQILRPKAGINRKLTLQTSD